MTSRYAETGVDVQKRGTNVFKQITSNLFPNAFCVVYRDPDLPDYGLILHSDGAGSKTVQNYLHWRETGDLRAFSYAADDVVAMNIDDAYCVNGNPIGLVDYVAINRFTMPKEDFLAALTAGFDRVFRTLEDYGIIVPFAGGETADLPDQVRTVDVSGTVSARVKLSDAITGESVQPGDFIAGLRNDGQAVWEETRNSGIMSNGLTLARHCLMSPDYERKYPEIRDPKGREYYGRFRTDEHVYDLGMTVGEALISPTRIFAPVVKTIIERYGKKIHGIVHNTGGGQTKLLRIGRDIHYVKDNLPEPPPIFYLIHHESGELWKDMYQGFNMGVGIDFIVPEDVAASIIKDSQEFSVGASVTGHCEENSDLEHANENGNRLTIRSKFGEFTYP